jgi:hypothetical protein
LFFKDKASAYFELRSPEVAIARNAALEYLMDLKHKCTFEILHMLLFHGGKSIFKTDFIETNKLWYMYDDVPNKENLYGKGFTIYGRLSKQTYSPLEGKINELIENKFFQKVNVFFCDFWLINFNQIV